MSDRPDPLPHRIVRRRHVFYISGFDPLGPARYYAIYSEEAARQAAVSGMRIEVGPRRNDGRLSTQWQVEAEEAGVTVHTTYEMLRWDDIVRAQWPRSRRVQVWQTLATTWYYFRTGAFKRLAGHSRSGFVVLVMPSVLMLGLPALVAALSLLCTSIWNGGVGLVVGVGAGAAAAWWARWLERQMQLAWLMRSFAFTRRYASGEVPALDERLDQFARRVAQCVQQGGCDEVLVVGHSSGVKWAVETVARTHRSMGSAGQDLNSPSLALLTLGHSVLMLSMVVAAQNFRNALRDAALAAEWAWIDFTAPADGSCAALVDPTVGCGALPGIAANRPKVLSPRFALLFSPQRYGELLRDRMRYHFLYLMAGEKPGAYDFFAITAGSMRLEDRYENHASIVHYRRKAHRSQKKKSDA